MYIYISLGWAKEFRMIQSLSKHGSVYRDCYIIAKLITGSKAGLSSYPQ